MTCGSVGLDVEMFANLFDNEEPSQLSVERDLVLLAQRVRAGTLDLVGVGRMHIANNDFVNKVRTAATMNCHCSTRRCISRKPWLRWSPVSSKKRTVEPPANSTCEPPGGLRNHLPELAACARSAVGRS